MKKEIVISVEQDSLDHEDDIVSYQASVVTEGVGGDESEYGRERSIDD